MNNNRILFVLPNLRSGGAERMIVNICNLLVSNVEKYDVTLVLMNDDDLSFKNILDEKVKLEVLNFRSVTGFLYNPFKFFRIVKKNQPRIIFSGYGEINPVLILYSFFLKYVIFIARETSIPSLRIKSKGLLLFYNLFYRFYDLIIVQSEAMKSDLIENFKIDAIRITKIFNPVDYIYLNEMTNGQNRDLDVSIRNLNGKRFIYIGTLNKQKRLESVIHFYESICKVHAECSLFIVGSGPSKNELDLIISKSQYKSSIFQTGFMSNPFMLLKDADFLIIASEYEGYPNVGIEANYLGVPILLSDQTLGGACELVIPGFNGEVLDFEHPDFEFLSKKYDKHLISEFILNRHSIDKINKQFFLLFK